MLGSGSKPSDLHRTSGNARSILWTLGSKKEMKRPFPKCGVCGAHGHIDIRCALYELNARQEAGLAIVVSIDDMGFTPEARHRVEREILRLRDSWRREAHAS